MGKILIQRIFVLVMTVSCTTASASTNKWVLDHDFENNLDTSQMLWDNNGISLLTCGSLCNLNPSCGSFFYHPSLKKCMESQSYKRGLPPGQSMQEEWNYYTKTQQCDGDYKFNKTLGLCFKIHPETKTFWEAMDACEAEEAKLIIIRNEMELLQVQDAVKAEEAMQEQCNQENAIFAQYRDNLSAMLLACLKYKTAGPLTWPFIGLRKDLSNGTITWKWWNGQIASYINWELGQPNILELNEYCVSIEPGNNYTYHDFGCFWQNSFICQRNL